MTQKLTDVEADVLFASVHSTSSPGDGVGYAMIGVPPAEISDNHGNWAFDHELFGKVDGKVRHYHLTDAQFAALWFVKIAPHAAAAKIGFRLNTDEIPLVNGVTESPLLTELHELEASNAPYQIVPVGQKSTPAKHRDR